MDREKLEKIIPVIAQKYHFRWGESFDLDKVFERFNMILKNEE